MAPLQSLEGSGLWDAMAYKPLVVGASDTNSLKSPRAFRHNFSACWDYFGGNMVFNSLPFFEVASKIAVVITRHQRVFLLCQRRPAAALLFYVQLTCSKVSHNNSPAMWSKPRNSCVMTQLSVEKYFTGRICLQHYMKVFSWEYFF